MAAVDISHLSLFTEINDKSSNIGISELYDKIYDSIGSFGRFQKFLSLVILWASIGMGLHSSVTIFAQPEIKCTNETKFLMQSESYYLNATEEFELFCEDDWKRSFSTTIFFVGFGVGAMSVGYMCDNFGRKVTLITGVQIVKRI